jgi:hypothetical protein
LIAALERLCGVKGIREQLRLSRLSPNRCLAGTPLRTYKFERDGYFRAA